MSAIGADDIERLIGVALYEEEGEFPVEQGYAWTSCASVENGNPLFWDDQVAERLAGHDLANRPELVPVVGSLRALYPAPRWR